MINPIKQGYATGIAVNNADSKNKQTKTNETQKMESDSRVSKIAEQIKNGTYKIDLSATATAVADSLL
ncbi:flagellar biosynthesis anti-sigma factor FlgM [Campylobacter sp. US33a]|uniref:Flagellar biosynthesis anti-sigma factor FlgM n=1 Tax=Campylobacter sp. CCS1377 TaxID=3158229 RepID=A0AAU7E562_9BACT|nr:flagellar biosynthesis anti-sigma factor FlgM [Campylobacter sp. US33a]MCW1359896.1 flagellar biosynthesis anti-sigma factor FlgM [Campylobacter jejuni]TEY03955.1 flagellar biosynthesis anti-sigma factor FlgM [Campylobacter sp. US33a]